MDEKDVEGDQLEERVDIINTTNVENQPIVLQGDQNSSVQESIVDNRVKIEQISERAESSFSRNVSKKTEVSDLPWRRRVITDTENNSSGTSSTGIGSSTWSSFPSYSRPSSRRRAPSNEERTYERGSTFKMKETNFESKFDENRIESSRFDRPAIKRIERNRPETAKDERFVGYKYLKALSEKEPHEAMCEILKPDAKISFVLNRKELQADWIFLIMATLRKLCESHFKSNRIQILQFFCESSLMDHVSHYLGEIGMEDNSNTIKNLNSFISDLVVFYNAVIKTIPTIAVDKNFDKFLKKTKMGIDLMKMFLNAEIDKTILDELENLERILEDETNVRDKKKEKPRRNYLDFVGNLPPPDDFRKLNLYPTQEDLNQDNFGFVRPNKIEGAYDDVDHYLDVQFRLIREDFIDPLRRGLKQYKDAVAHQSNRPKNKYESVRFYPNTRIEGIEVSEGNKVAYVVNFNTNGRLNRVKWEYSKWFMFGSLLLFTRDNFNSFFFATVFNRDLERLNAGHILVTLVGSEPLESEMLKQPLLMAESEIYFEPYCLVMKALKDLNEDDFPMKQFIVEGKTTVDFPQYIKDSDEIYIFDNLVNVLQNTDWPHHSAIGFDEHQFDAFKTALTSNFTVIQGPPGTGKTYLGLKIVEVLLSNIDRKSNFLKLPILLVCYTNHALDQFLEGILEFTDKIVRIGGQSKSELLLPFNLRGKKNLSHLRWEVFPALKHCRDEMRKISSDIRLKIKEKEIIENPIGILSYAALSRVMSADFKRTIKDEKKLLFWLFNNDISTTENALRIIRGNKTAETNVYINPTNSSKVDNEIYEVEEDETLKADLLINEDDVFDAQNVNWSDMSVTYCISMQDIENSFLETRKKLKLLNSDLFDDYSEYYNYEYQLQETLKITDMLFGVLKHYCQHGGPDSSVEYHTSNENLWKMPINQRWNTYWALVSRLRDYVVEDLKFLETDYRCRSQQYEEFKQMEDLHIVQNAHVVGMTTTCAARLQLLLKTLSPAIVIVEEAAEVLESHIVVSLSKKSEHVILIGDHKQLKPSTAVFELSKKYNINVSLFERMINNKMYCPTLKIQHRMREEICKLIVPSIYPDLKNHESVLEYPSVKGITKNLFFVEHNVYEETVDDSSSRKNKFEAEFMIQLCRYILLQGYESDQITILTTYTGQMFLLREMKRYHEIIKHVKVIVVDKYQGEENDIILLSLVRSNEERKIGFLSIENRVCVALSRAKIGLYIIGNMDILSDSPLWTNIKKELIEQEAIGPKLTLYCDKHDVYTQVSCKSDFDSVIEGGCHNFCHAVMDCGHKCQTLCHKIDTEHLEKKCREKCLKRCVENHPCTRYCYEDCGPCIVPVERNLPCGHTATLPCFSDYQKYECRVEFSVILEPCSHEVKKLCFQSIEQVKCIFPCEDRLECGHQCMQNCHKTCDPDHLEYQCFKPCEKISGGCSEEHKCKKRCYEECGKCRERIDFTLTCGHSINLECSANLARIKCYQSCDKKCPECNASCPKRCFEDCKPCQNKVMKRIPDCGHEKIMECGIAAEQHLCRRKCQRIAPCGHKCKSLCGEPCGTEPCVEIVKSTCVQAVCGHGFADIQCWRKDEAVKAEELLPYCTEPCGVLLKCGDLCSGTCGSCWQGCLHQTCQQKCGNVLVCGHSCTYPCRNLCPPCVKKCQYSCKHSKCPKNCGVPCVHCKEKCQWKCAHLKCTRKCGDICNRPKCYEPCPRKLRCKHDCIGFCGEPCPKKCRICDKEEVTTIIFGNEDEEDARFILLEDCGHIIESEAMDRYISMPAEKGEIVMKLCPLCKTQISKTLRYMNEVKKVFRDIQNVKKKIYGDDKEMQQIRADLGQKLRDLALSNDFLQDPELILIPRTVEAFRRMIGSRGKQSLSRQALRAMLFFTNVFSNIISRLHDIPSSRSCIDQKRLIFKRLSSLLKRMNPATLHINMQMLEDVDRELNRYHRAVDYVVQLPRLRLKIRGLQNSDVTSLQAEIDDILFGWKCFDNEQDARIGELFEKLQNETNSVEPVSQEEKRMIHAAMAKDFLGGVNSQGHWFTCTNGHYYCITECGGAMEESKCPECGEAIGGRNHQYVDTVQVASDMDGATKPAWTSNADMRNYVFN